MFSNLFIFHDCALLILRLALGLIFLAHGIRKAKKLSPTMDWFASLGFRPGWFWAPLVMGVEILGSVMLITGFFTQVAAVLLAFNMAVAFFVNARNKEPFFKVLELDLILFAALLLVAATGGGVYSLDQYWLL